MKNNVAEQLKAQQRDLYLGMIVGVQKGQISKLDAVSLMAVTSAASEAFCALAALDWMIEGADK